MRHDGWRRALAAGGALLAAAALAAGFAGGTGCSSPVVPGFAIGQIETYAGKGVSGYTRSGRTLLNTVLNMPCDVTVDVATGDIWVIDYGNQRILVAFAGTDTLHEAAGLRTGVPSDDPNLLNHPSGVTLDAHGARILLAWHDHQVRRLNRDGSVDFLWGAARGFGGDGGPARAARFDYPSSGAWGADSTLYISDAGNLRIRAVLPDAADFRERTVVTVAGSGDTTLTADGTPGLQTGFDGPVSDAAAFPALRVALSPDRRTLYVADTFHHRIRAMDCLDPAHPVRTVAGSGATGGGRGGFGGDGGTATAATFNTPTDVEVDSDGTVYVCDSFNNRVRAFLPGGAVRTVAGTGDAGFGGDGGPAIAARLSQPNGIALDRAHGLLYIADLGNHRIRRVRLR